MYIPSTYEQAATKLTEPPEWPFNFEKVKGKEAFIALQFSGTTLVRYYEGGLVFGFAMAASMADREIIREATRQLPGQYTIADVDGTIAVVAFPEDGDKAAFIVRLFESGCTTTPIIDLYRAAKACFI